MTNLLDVQRLDVDSDRLRHQLEHLPQRAALVEARAEQASHQLGIDEVGVARVVVATRQKRAEDEAQILAEKVATDEGRLYGGDVKGMKDLEALQHEIEGLQGRQRTFEDDALVAMEEAEELAERVASLEADRADVDSRIAVLEEEIVAQEAAISAQLETAIEERAAAAATVEPDLLTEYERLRPAYGSATAVSFNGSGCVGCPSAMPAMEIDRMKRLDDPVASCDECGRIVLR